MKLNEADAAAALAHYGIRTSTHAHSGTSTGESIRIVGRTDATGMKAIAVENAFHGVERLVPLGDAGAEILAVSFRGREHRGTNEQKRRMLEHLLLRVSEFFDTSGVVDFQLAVCLHENAYTVDGVEMTAKKSLGFKPRLAPHARDRKAKGYRPDPVTEPHRRM